MEHTALGSPRLIDSPTRRFFLTQQENRARDAQHDDSFGKEEQPTLADIKRRARREAEEARNDSHVKRFQTLNFTSENSRQLDEADLRPYYCAVCGQHCAVIEGGIERFASVDDCRVVPTEEAFYKIYVEPSEQILIRRQQRGVEHRFIYRCSECQFQLAFRVKAGKGEALTQYA